MRHGALCDTIDSILEQYNEDMSWSYYLSYIASIIRPLEADVSFNDFKKKLINGNTSNKQGTKDGNTMNKKQVNEQVAKAENMLKGFVPVKEGGSH